jgi:cysteinylglycine-S-conjugate dipeptidase
VTDLPTSTRVPTGLDDVTGTLLAQLPETRAWLEELVRIPSISDLPAHAADCRRSADRTADLLREAGLEDVRLLEIDGAHPYVTGAWSGAGEDAPTVLLYAHHDVQPATNPERWTSPPFEPNERDGRLFGRGAADDKAGILAHVAAIRAWHTARGGPPVNVKVIIEGEEEIGSPHLGDFLAAHAEELAADVIVLTDLVNFKVGWPSLTWSLRGLAELVVSVRSLRRPVHSGMWGGAVPDALTGLVRLLATLHDDEGEIAVAGIDDDVRALTPDERARLEELDEDPAGLRDEVGMLDGVDLVGDARRGLFERLWFRPTITPVGIDAPAVEEASNTLAAQARAKLSLRLAPGQDPDRVVAAVTHHLRAHAPFGLHVEVEPGHGTGRTRLGGGRGGDAGRLRTRAGGPGMRGLDPLRRAVQRGLRRSAVPARRHRGPGHQRPRGGRVPAPRGLRQSLPDGGLPPRGAGTTTPPTVRGPEWARQHWRVT